MIAPLRVLAHEPQLQTLPSRATWRCVLVSIIKNSGFSEWRILGRIFPQGVQADTTRPLLQVTMKTSDHLTSYRVNKK